MLQFDEHLTAQIREAGSTALPFWRWFATYGIGVLIACAFVMIAVGSGEWFALLIPAALTHAITLGLQHVIRRPRPSVDVSKIQMWYRTPSFPSAHSAGSMALALAMSAFLLGIPEYGMALTLIVLSFALLIGISRIMVGVHYLGDVLAGFLFGLLVTGIFLSVL